MSTFAASEIFGGMKIKNVHKFASACGSWINGLSAQSAFNGP